MRVAVLEAASIGVDILPGEVAMRCNLVCLEGDLLKNHSADIFQPMRTELIRFLEKGLGGGQFSFHPGVSYRHLLKIKGGSKILYVHHRMIYLEAFSHSFDKAWGQ